MTWCSRRTVAIINARSAVGPKVALDPLEISFSEETRRFNP
jgi:hypothetical protein